MPKLARILLYPVKSLDPQSVDEAVILPSGALQYDRRYALCDEEGKFINGKRTPAVHCLRSHLDLAHGVLTLCNEETGKRQTFDVERQQDALVGWLSEYFGMPVRWIENPGAGFPDDTEAPGPTLISTATLAEVARWFEGLGEADARARFRANLEIDAPEPFWEDRLYTVAPGVVRLQIGEAELLGSNPCQRCVVPTRNALSGQVTPQFAKLFAQRRRDQLPAWAARERFDHYYRLAVNTRPASATRARIRVGDEVRLLD